VLLMGLAISAAPRRRNISLYASAVTRVTGALWAGRLLRALTFFYNISYNILAALACHRYTPSSAWLSQPASAFSAPCCPFHHAGTCSLPAARCIQPLSSLCPVAPRTLHAVERTRTRRRTPPSRLLRVGTLYYSRRSAAGRAGRRWARPDVYRGANGCGLGIILFPHPTRVYSQRRAGSIQLLLPAPPAAYDATVLQKTRIGTRGSVPGVPRLCASLRFFAGTF